MQKKTALIFDIYRGTTHDGPGIRSTVFFKGCPLSCSWCHNPEGISTKQQIWWYSTRCIGCGICINTCQNHAIYSNESGIHIDQELCKQCLSCTKQCPSKALQPIGKEYTVESLLKELQKDKLYYQQSGGGVTVSGGEVMLQYEFIQDLFARLHQEEISTALDTSGFTTFEHLKNLLPHTDYILYDLKLLDDMKHCYFTGQSNRIILENFEKLIHAKRAGENNFELWIRTPLIPKVTATKENITAIARLLQPYLGNYVNRWELCAFNNACKDKYHRLDKIWAYENDKHLTAQEAHLLQQYALNQGLDPKYVILTGILT